MKTTGLSLAAVAAACFSVAPVYAHQQKQSVSAVDPGSEVERVVVPAQRVHLEPNEVTDYEYAYNLDNGDSVRFSRRVMRFYATIKGQQRVEIFATGTNQFVTASGAKLVFTEDGEVLNIDHYEALQAAAGMPVAVR